VGPIVVVVAVVVRMKKSITWLFNTYTEEFESTALARKVIACFIVLRCQTEKVMPTANGEPKRKNVLGR